MEYFDNLVISLLDSDANKGLFIGELCQILNIPKLCIGNIWLETELVNGVVSQELWVSLMDASIKKEDLMRLPFKEIYDNCLVFEVGDTIL